MCKSSTEKCKEGKSVYNHTWASTSTDLESAARTPRCSVLLFQQCPVKGVVVLMVECAEENTEQLAQVHVVWGLLKSQSPAVVEVHRKFGRKSLDRRKKLKSPATVAHNLKIINFTKYTYTKQQIASSSCMNVASCVSWVEAQYRVGVSLC